MRQVIVKFKAYKEMIKFFSQYSSNKIPKDKWVESMGFLFCNIEGDYYIIEDAIGMTSGTELDVQLSPLSLGNLPDLEREHDGFLGGWWHTHPGLTPFFSETDIKNQVFYQTANPDGLGIVFDHSMIDNDFLGFQIFRLIHQFSEEYVEVPYQLLGFTKEGIKECMNLLGINREITENLANKYSQGQTSIKIDFSKIGEPIVDDPLADSEWLIMEADDLIKQEKIIDGIKKYKTAAIILENTEYIEKYGEILVKVINLCMNNNYEQNAKEEYELFKKIEDKISKDSFAKLNKEISKRF
ncbi:MAG: hypothetical protein ACTSQJ_01210 [Promethearchaeota archaeon]